MSIAKDLTSEVVNILKSQWTTRDGTVVPEPEDLQLGNDAVKLTGTVLYADLAESTELVNTKDAAFAAEIYKIYLHCASKIIKDAGGVVTAFDGDRVMGVFMGNSKNTSAVRCGLKINYAVTQIINPAVLAQYPSGEYEVRHSVGIDTSSLFVARTGVRGSNDLVWVGRSANYAAKLCSLRTGSYATWITPSVYDNMHESARITNGTNMWNSFPWSQRGITVYASTWRWTP